MTKSSTSIYAQGEDEPRARRHNLRAKWQTTGFQREEIERIHVPFTNRLQFNSELQGRAVEAYAGYEMGRLMRDHSKEV